MRGLGNETWVRNREINHGGTRCVKMVEVKV